MPAVAEPPPRKPQAPPGRRRAAPTPDADSPGERRFLLRDIPWDLYVRLSDAAVDAGPRMTYDDGLLELEMPTAQLHEMLKGVAHDWLVAFMEESGVDYLSLGNSTWRRQAAKGALEADESFYIARFREMVESDADFSEVLDLDRYPPPDLAIEIDLSRPQVEKANVYARLGVPEIWRWRDGRIAVLLRTKAGKYRNARRSAALPGFPLDALAAELARTPHPDQPAALRAFRKRCREAAEAR